MMRGDFLANKEYIVSKYGDRITFLQIQPDYEMFELYLQGVPEKTLVSVERLLEALNNELQIKVG